MGELYPIPLDTILGTGTALAAGAEVRVLAMADDAAVPMYSKATGTVAPPPTTADSRGRIPPRWVPAGEHKLQIAGAGAETRLIPFTVGQASKMSPELSASVASASALADEVTARQSAISNLIAQIALLQPDGNLEYGSGAPGSGVGQNGDSYVDTSTSPPRLYGPKAGGIWPSTYVTLGGGSGGGSVAIPRPGVASYRAGRTWAMQAKYAGATSTEFDGHDLALFDIQTGAGGLERVTDPAGRPAVRRVSGYTNGSVATLLTKAADIRDAEIRFRLRPATDNDSFSSGQVAPQIVMRRLGADGKNEWRVYEGYSSSNAALRTIKSESYRNGSTAGNSTSASGSKPATTDTKFTTTDRIVVVRILGDFVQSKSWWADEAEPAAWDTGTRHRPFTSTTNASGASATEDNTEMGAFGLRMLNGGHYVINFSVTELIRDESSNLLHNAGLRTIDKQGGVGGASDFPLFWFPQNASPNTMEVVSVVDAEGFTRPVFHINRPTKNASNCHVYQYLHNSRFVGIGDSPNNRTRLHAHPQAAFPSAIEVSCISKGLNIVNDKASGKIGAAIVTYAYDRKSTGFTEVWPSPAPPLPGDNHAYVQQLGPNGGEGTWPWTYQSWHFPLSDPYAMELLRAQVMFHDAANQTGELWIYGLTFRPISGSQIDHATGAWA